MWSGLFSREHQRQRLLRQTAAGPLQDFYRQPFPSGKTPIREVSFAVLDFETTGLDVKKDHIISIGLVEIVQLGIQLGSAWQQIVTTHLDMPEKSTVIHQITDDMVAQGIKLEEAMAQLLPRLAGKVLIAHHATLETGLLQRACQNLYQQKFVAPLVDTEALAKRKLQRQQQILKEDSLRLFNLREEYHLPVYKAHNALSDALSTAELFLALLAELCPKLDCRLRDIQCR